MSRESSLLREALVTARPAAVEVPDGRYQSEVSGWTGREGARYPLAALVNRPEMADHVGLAAERPVAAGRPLTLVRLGLGLPIAPSRRYQKDARTVKGKRLTVLLTTLVFTLTVRGVFLSCCVKAMLNRCGVMVQMSCSNDMRENMRA